MVVVVCSVILSVGLTVVGCVVVNDRVVVDSTGTAVNYKNKYLTGQLLQNDEGVGRTNFG